MLKSLTFAALLSLPIAVFAQDQTGKTVTKENAVTATATIRAIDPATRSITLRTEKGDEDTFTVGPEVTRFDQLKVGDTIRATYYEAVVFQLRKPGTASGTSGTTVGRRPPQGGTWRRHRRATDDDGDGESRGREGAVDHRHDAGRPDADAEDRRRQEPGGCQSRRSHRHHLHPGAGRQRRGRKVAARDSGLSGSSASAPGNCRPLRRTACSRRGSRSR